MIYKDKTFRDCYSLVKTDDTHVHLLSTDGRRRKRVPKADFMRDYESLPEIIGTDDKSADITYQESMRVRDWPLRIAVVLAIAGLLFLAMRGK